MVLPHNSLIHTINASQNRFVNIMHSLCGNLPQRCLEYIDVSFNHIEDLIIGTQDSETRYYYGHKSCSVFPRLRYLNCNNNYVCFISQLPFTLKCLMLENNDLTIDRLMAKNITEVDELKYLSIKGNFIDE